MISLIVCSRSIDISDELKQNIQSTIGAEYELVAIDNSQNEYSIFSAYNEGVRRSKYPYLCFMHDDIIYHTQGWGLKVIEHFVHEFSFSLVNLLNLISHTSLLFVLFFPSFLQLL